MEMAIAKQRLKTSRVNKDTMTVTTGEKLWLMIAQKIVVFL